jgi:steroid 5-alpha reductase family enzyme
LAQKQTLRSIIQVGIAVAIGGGVAWAGSDGGVTAWGVPVFALCAAIAFAINWIAFVPAAISRTEHYYDLIGGVTYITVMLAALLLSGNLDLRAGLVGGMVMVWALRLASFLFLRISKAGKDGRFDDIKTQPLSFLMAWTVQALWVLLTAAAALAVITGGVHKPIGVVGIAGLAIWAGGMAIEVIADRQKSAFRSDPANSGKFIDSGLWAWSRHPNYFGEIMLWTGMAIVALPVLDGWRYVTLISPVFVAFLLIRVSGIPLLEKRADERWGGQEAYESYKRRTPVLIPRPPGLGRDRGARDTGNG